MSSTEQAPDVVFRDDTLLLGTYQAVLIAHWRQTPTIAHVEQIGRALSQHGARCGTKVAWLSILRDSCLRTPEAAVLDAFRSVGSALAPVVRTHAVVIVVPGVTGMLLRTMFRGAAVRFTSLYPLKIFDEIKAGADWTAQHAPCSETKLNEWLSNNLGSDAPSGAAGGSPLDDITRRVA